MKSFSVKKIDVSCHQTCSSLTIILPSLIGRRFNVVAPKPIENFFNLFFVAYTTIMKRNETFVNELYTYILKHFIDGFGDMGTWNYWMGLKHQYRIIKDNSVDLHVEFDGNHEVFVDFRLLNNLSYSMNYFKFFGIESRGALLL